jgi:hypothetical protein
MRAVTPAAFALVGVLCGTMTLPGVRTSVQAQEKSYPGGHWEPSGGSANQVRYTGHYSARIGFSTVPLSSTAPAVSGNYEVLVTVKEVGQQPVSGALTGSFRTERFPTDEPCGGLPYYPGVQVDRKPCWRVTFSVATSQVPPFVQRALLNEQLPGPVAVSYVVSAQGSPRDAWIVLTPTRKDGTPYDRLDLGKPADLRWRMWLP